MDEYRLTPKAQRKADRRFAAQLEAAELIGIIAAEFKSDPMSVQCFDLRIVERAIACSAELDATQDVF